LLSSAEFDIQKEAAWAISNATSGGRPEQLMYLAREGCIPLFCNLLREQDAKVVSVAIEGFENLLHAGDESIAKVISNLLYYYQLFIVCFSSPPTPL